MSDGELGQTPAPVGAVDRAPKLAELVRSEDLERCLRPFIVGAVDGALVFDRGGTRYGGAYAPQSPMALWEVLPAEAFDATRRGRAPRFRSGEHVFEARPIYAGTERIGLLVVGRHGSASDPRDAALADALSEILAQLFQAAFATWVTSEIHMAASENSHRALTQQNAELRRAIAHLRELDKLKSNFLATVSHELRTPLTSVIGFSEMLLDGLAGGLNGEQREYVQTIFTRAEELLALITQVLEMSQLEVGAVRLELKPWSVASIVGRAFESVQLSADRNKVQLRAQLCEVPMVLVDGSKLHRVLVNLVGNAIKFSRPGGEVTVEARIAPIRRPFREETIFGDEPDDAVRISVVDTGIGIAEDQIERVFDAFYQADASPTRAHGGAGLGLSIVASLIKAHGGEAWVDSELGVGTKVHVTVPIASDAIVAEGSSDES